MKTKYPVKYFSKFCMNCLCFQVLRRDLVSALKKKRPGVPMDYFLWHQDNASPHTAESTL